MKMTGHQAPNINFQSFFFDAIVQRIYNYIGQFAARKDINPIDYRMCKKMKLIAADRIFESHETSLRENRKNVNPVFLMLFGLSKAVQDAY